MDLTTVRTAIALSVISIAHAAHAQTGAPPTPPDAMSGVIRHVPAISLTFAVGQVAIEPRATAPIAEAGAVIRLHRHFALDLGAGHFQTRRSESFPGMVEHLADGTT